MIKPSIDTKKIELSAIDIALNSPFLARAVHQLTLCANETISTMCTDGTTIQYSPSFVASLTRNELAALRVHEILHVLLGHHLRRGDRNLGRWNIACDYAVNPLVEAAGYCLPPDSLINPAYANLSAEKIYELLQNQEQQLFCSWGEVTDAPLDNKSEATWQILVQSTCWSHLPATLNRALMEQLHPRPLLADILTPLLTSFLPDNYSWARGKRVGSTILPRLDGRVGHVVICVDTSGSILTSALAEMWRLVMGALCIGTIDIICADAKVQSTHFDCSSLDNIREAQISARGGGGTNFGPALVMADAREPDVIVYLTDLEGSFPSTPPQAPVIWVTNKEISSPPPWGQVVISRNEL